VPCLAEGCDRHINSLSDCLQQLRVNRVIQAIETMLAESKFHTLTVGCP
jgi:heptosyltransferase-3